VHPHQLRHACAVALRQQGVSLDLLSDFLGHKNVNTTRRYARLVPADLKKQLPERM